MEPSTWGVRSTPLATSLAGRRFPKEMPRTSGQAGGPSSPPGAALQGCLLNPEPLPLVWPLPSPLPFPPPSPDACPRSRPQGNSLPSCWLCSQVALPMPSFPLLKSLPLFTVKQESHPCRLHPTALEMLSHPPTPNTTNSHLPAIGLCSSWWQEANFGIRPRGTVILPAFFQYLLRARHGMAWA